MPLQCASLREDFLETLSKESEAIRCWILTSRRPVKPPSAARFYEQMCR